MVSADMGGQTGSHEGGLNGSPVSYFVYWGSGMKMFVGHHIMVSRSVTNTVTNILRQCSDKYLPIAHVSIICHIIPEFR